MTEFDPECAVLPRMRDKIPINVVERVLELHEKFPERSAAELRKTSRKTKISESSIRQIIENKQKNDVFLRRRAVRTIACLYPVIKKRVTGARSPKAPELTTFAKKLRRRYSFKLVLDAQGRTLQRDLAIVSDDVCCARNLTLGSIGEGSKARDRKLSNIISFFVTGDDGKPVDVRNEISKKAPSPQKGPKKRETPKNILANCLCGEKSG